MKSKTPLLDVLPKITQWESIPYAADLTCQDCGKTGFVNADEGYPNLVGWCETSYGYMAIFECPICGNKFRFHCAEPVSDIEEFDTTVTLAFAERCGNWEDLEIKMEEKRLEQFRLNEMEFHECPYCNPGDGKSVKVFFDTDYVSMCVVGHNPIANRRQMGQMQILDKVKGKITYTEIERCPICGQLLYEKEE